jgi:hypothetical protein
LRELSRGGKEDGGEKVVPRFGLPNRGTFFRLTSLFILFLFLLVYRAVFDGGFYKFGEQRVRG